MFKPEDMEPNEVYQVAEITLFYNSPSNFGERPNAGTSKEAYNILSRSWNSGTIEFIEEFKILFLNRRNKIIALYEMTKGGTSSTVVDMKLLMAAALKTNASKIILAHNHPAGTLAPSEQDICITRRVSEACKIFDITLVDHLILSGTDYYSFADNGLV